MTAPAATPGAKKDEMLSPKQVIERFGNCLELVPIDPNFHDISVGLYEKNGVATAWTFSQMEGATERLDQIVDRLVKLGGMERVDGARHQVRFPCGTLHHRPLRFLTTAAVERTPDRDAPDELSIRDSKSPLTIHMIAEEIDGRHTYRISATGEFRNPEARLRAVIAGFVRYGEMEKIADDRVAFTCGQRHDALARLILPYSRNISAVADALEADALRGQMTTSTLGFSTT